MTDTKYSSDIEKQYDIVRNSDIHKDYVVNLMRKVRVMTYKQLVFFISGRFNFEKPVAEFLIKKLQRQNRIIVSTDLLVTTMDYYRTVTGDTFFDALVLNDDDFVIPFPFKQMVLEFDHKLEDHLKVMQLLANNMPLSDNFILNSAPWDAMFIVEENEEYEQALYEIIVINSNEALAKTAMLKAAFDNEDPELKEVIKRIAIVDDEMVAKLIPFIGFETIIMADKDYSLKVVEEREETWR